MSNERAAERLGEDVAEFVLQDVENELLLKRIRESRQSQREHECIHPDARRNGRETSRLAHGTRERVRRLRPGRRRPGRRSRMVNAALGAAIFATVSGAALIVLESPYSYIFAAGSAALAVITMVRETRNRV